MSPESCFFLFKQYLSPINNPLFCMKQVIVVGAYSMYQYVRVRQSDTCAMLGYIGLRRRAPEKLGV